MVEILYSCFNKKLSSDSWNIYFKLMPEEIRDKISRFKRWQDRHSRLLGKLLLLEGLRKFGLETSILKKLLYNENGRPYIENGVDFNISHSGEYIVCAITEKGKVGIDIEKIRPINVYDFKKWLPAEQYIALKESDVPNELFFEFWTKNESILKSYGGGLSVSMLDINMDSGMTVLYNKRWYLKKIHLNSLYKCHLALSIEDHDLNIREVRY